MIIVKILVGGAVRGSVRWRLRFYQGSCTIIMQEMVDGAVRGSVT